MSHFICTVVKLYLTTCNCWSTNLSLFLIKQLHKVWSDVDTLILAKSTLKINFFIKLIKYLHIYDVNIYRIGRTYNVVSRAAQNYCTPLTDLCFLPHYLLLPTSLHHYLAPNRHFSRVNGIRWTSRVIPKPD